MIFNSDPNVLILMRKPCPRNSNFLTFLSICRKLIKLLVFFFFCLISVYVHFNMLKQQSHTGIQLKKAHPRLKIAHPATKRFKPEPSTHLCIFPSILHIGVAQNLRECWQCVAALRLPYPSIRVSAACS